MPAPNARSVSLRGRERDSAVAELFALAQIHRAAALARLERASKDSSANTMPHIIDAVRAGATVGEVCGVWRRVFGEYREVMAV